MRITPIDLLQVSVTVKGSSLLLLVATAKVGFFGDYLELVDHMQTHSYLIYLLSDLVAAQRVPFFNVSYHSCSPISLSSGRVQPQTQRAHNLQDRGKFRVAVRRERFIKALPPEPCLAGNLAHSFRPRNVT